MKDLREFEKILMEHIKVNQSMIEWSKENKPEVLEIWKNITDESKYIMYLLNKYTR